MYKKRITLRPDRPNLPLDPIWPGRNSSALLVLAGVSSGFTARLYLTKVGADVAVYFDAQRNSHGDMCVYVPGANFPAPGAGRYEVIITEESTGRNYWCGSGAVTVLAASSGSVNPGYGTALETYVRNPVTRLWHKVTAEINKYGEITTVVDQEGVELS